MSQGGQAMITALLRSTCVLPVFTVVHAGQDHMCMVTGEDQPAPQLPQALPGTLPGSEHCLPPKALPSVLKSSPIQGGALMSRQVLPFFNFTPFFLILPQVLHRPSLMSLPLEGPFDVWRQMSCPPLPSPAALSPLGIHLPSFSSSSGASFWAPAFEKSRLGTDPHVHTENHAVEGGVPPGSPSHLCEGSLTSVDLSVTLTFGQLGC